MGEGGGGCLQNHKKNKRPPAFILNLRVTSLDVNKDAELDIELFAILFLIKFINFM